MAGAIERKGEGKLGARETQISFPSISCIALKYQLLTQRATYIPQVILLDLNIPYFKFSLNTHSINIAQLKPIHVSIVCDSTNAHHPA